MARGHGGAPRLALSRELHFHDRRGGRADPTSGQFSRGAPVPGRALREAPLVAKPRWLGPSGSLRASRKTVDSKFPHQSGNPLAPHPPSLHPQFPVDSRRAVLAVMAGVDAADLLLEKLVHPGAATLGTTLPSVVTAPRDSERAGHGGDSVLSPVPVHEPVDHLVIHGAGETPGVHASRRLLAQAHRRRPTGAGFGRPRQRAWTSARKGLRYLSWCIRTPRLGPPNHQAVNLRSSVPDKNVHFSGDRVTIMRFWPSLCDGSTGPDRKPRRATRSGSGRTGTTSGLGARRADG